jgi:hypothetical protein
MLQQTKCQQQKSKKTDKNGQPFAGLAKMKRGRHWRPRISFGASV